MRHRSRFPFGIPLAANFFLRRLFSKFWCVLNGVFAHIVAARSRWLYLIFGNISFRSTFFCCFDDNTSKKYKRKHEHVIYSLHRFPKASKGPESWWETESEWGPTSIEARQLVLVLVQTVIWPATSRPASSGDTLIRYLLFLLPHALFLFASRLVLVRLKSPYSLTLNYSRVAVLPFFVKEDGLF